MRFRFCLVRVRGLCHGGPLVSAVPEVPPFALSSHVTLEDRLLFCLPSRSRRRTSFWRHRRSVQALVSLCQVTPDKTVKGSGAQASSATFGSCDRSGIGVGRTSSRPGVSGWRGRGESRPGGHGGIYPSATGRSYAEQATHMGPWQWYVVFKGPLVRQSYHPTLQNRFDIAKQTNGAER